MRPGLTLVVLTVLALAGCAGGATDDATKEHDVDDRPTMETVVARYERMREDVRREVLPYLRRQGLEAGVSVESAGPDASLGPEEVVDEAVRLSRRLREHQRQGDHELGLARTQPVPRDDG